MPDAAYLKDTVKELQRASAESNIEKIATLLRRLKRDFEGPEFILKQSQAIPVVKTLRNHESKKVSHLAGKVLKQWHPKVEQGGAKRAVAAKTRAAVRKKTPSGPPSRVRTLKSDGVDPQIVHDSTREKCIELVCSALASDSAAPVASILAKAKAIEAAVFRDMGGITSAYRQRLRSLLVNLKDEKNPSLRKAVGSGDIPVDEFVKMSNREMASEEQKKAYDAINEDDLFHLLGAEEQEAETSAFTCPKCNAVGFIYFLFVPLPQWTQRKSRYRQLQTRSADEPMTTYVHCVNCKHRFKF
ncbi:transcription factor S-II, central domain-containing protein [Mycena polygramma]|nr:transcription factor S-II, central domain-containing protein [Mycena polygramma]